LLTAERRLLQDVSHELRSPLARLEFAVELARNSPDPERSFARITKEIDRLSKLVSELLLVTRAEGDPESRHMGEIALGELLGGVVEDSGMESEARGCKVALSAATPAVVLGDGELLRRAVENVVRNAIRFAPYETAVEVKLEVSGNSAVITVRDYGPGAPAEKLSSLSKPFFRVEEDRNRNSGGGVGLGLSIAERAVKVHGGELQVRNAYPGLLVTMELPLAPQRQAVAVI
jgi:two-component system sensor histidine kinase CpxA